MKIYLVRHTSVAVQGICYGQSNVPLSDTFEQEANIVREKVEAIGIQFDAVYSSPLSRCRKLATRCGYKDSRLLSDRLKELYFGEWEMHAWKDIDMTIWQDDWVNVPTPNGESLQMMYKRVISFLDELREKDLSHVLIFTHGGVMNCVRAYVENIELKDSFNDTPVYGQIEIFEL